MHGLLGSWACQYVLAYMPELGAVLFTSTTCPVGSSTVTFLVDPSLKSGSCQFGVHLMASWGVPRFDLTGFGVWIAAPELRDHSRGHLVVQSVALLHQSVAGHQKQTPHEQLARFTAHGRCRCRRRCYIVNSPGLASERMF